MEEERAGRKRWNKEKKPQVNSDPSLTSIGCELERASKDKALEYSRLRKLVQISNSGWVWSTHRYSIQVANPSFSQRWVHHSMVT